MAQGIRQNLDSQKRVFIEHFFSTGRDPIVSICRGFLREG
jgi:hypothetical protein